LLESTVSFHKNRFHQVNTGQTMSTRVKNEFQAVSGQNRVHRVNIGQTMSTRVKNEFQAVSGQNRHFQPKPSPPGQYGSNHVEQSKNEFSDQNRRFRSKLSPPSQYGSNHVDQGKKWVSGRFGSKLLFLVKTWFTGLIPVKSFFFSV